MTYRVVKIERCEKPQVPIPCVARVGGGMRTCRGCQGNGTRMVDHGEIERAPDWWWSPTEQAATAGTWGHGDDRAVWVEVKP